jgi:hypothetical protein
MKTKLKLFIWTGFSPDYTDGLAFAIAADEAEARKMIIKEYGLEPTTWGSLEVRRLDQRVVRYVCGGG